MRIAPCLPLCLAALAGCNDPAGLSDAQASRRVIMLASATAETCALTADAAIWCWVLPVGGSDTVTRLRKVETPEPLVSMAGGLATFGNQFCGQTREGAVYCWGRGNEIESDYTYGDGVTPVWMGDFLPGALAVGGGHVCALAADSTARCWGFYGGGKRGVLMDVPPDLVPNPVPGGEHFRSLAAGGGHTCGVRGDGTLACWGAAYSLAGATAGLDFSLACWPYIPCSVEPHLILAQVGVRWLAAGGERTCALGNSGLTCWGKPWQLSPGTLRAGSGGALVDVVLPEAPVSVAIGPWNACALTVAGSAWCWGDYGPVMGRDSLTVGASAPTRVPFAGAFESLSLGSEAYCGLTTRGEVYCWGITAGPSFNAVPIVTPVRIPIPRS